MPFGQRKRGIQRDGEGCLERHLRPVGDRLYDPGPLPLRLDPLCPLGLAVLPLRYGSSCAMARISSHEDIQRKQRAHQQVGYINGLADAQIDHHAAQRVGLLASEAPCFEVIYHVE